MKILLTGCSGFLGSNIAVQMLKSGLEVKAIYRGTVPAGSIEGVDYVQADLCDAASLVNAVNNCDAVIHAGGLVKMWEPDASRFMEVNYYGTKKLLKACQTVGVKRFVYVSTAGVIGPTTEVPATELYRKSMDLSCDYVTSKQLAGKEVLFAGETGMDVNIVYPSRMYGPGPLNHANSITKMMDDFRKGHWYFRPPYGNVTGSYNHVAEVANGVVNALLKGVPGERYLLAGDNITYDSFFEALRIVTGKRQLLYTAPFPLLYMFSLLQEKYARMNHNFTATMNTTQIKRFQYHYAFDSSKAVREINYKVVPFEYGLQRTIEWLEKN